MAKAELSFTLAIIALAAIICPVRSRGQEPNNNQETKTAVTEPEYADVFFRLDAGALVPLERQTAGKIRVRTSGFILVKAQAQSTWEISGAKSPVRFSGGKLEFVVRALNAGIDPQTQYLLRMLIGKKNSREMIAVTARVGVFGGASSSMNTEGLPVTFTRYGNSSVKMTVGSLPPGEYAIGKVYGAIVPIMFCFGVD